jgi:hypothetical protein
MVPLAGSGGGFRWQHAVTGDAGAVEVTVRYSDAPAAPGRWRDEIATIRGLRAGRAAVRFVQQRPWESAGEGVDTADPSDEVIEVTVLDV